MLNQLSSLLDLVQQSGNVLVRSTGLFGADGIHVLILKPLDGQ